VGRTDDHHEQLIGADQCSHLASPGTAAFRRAESSITIELA
jgi:hypothetical protein